MGGCCHACFAYLGTRNHQVKSACSRMRLGRRRRAHTFDFSTGLRPARGFAFGRLSGLLRPYQRHRRSPCESVRRMDSVRTE